MSALRGVSIIVSNHNMEKFLAAAIDSALAQDHPVTEVIVLDDASTDGSREIIAGYGSRLRVLLREKNDGQVVGLNAAWPLARYSIVIFLDSDDTLLPQAASRLAATFSETTAKVQFCLQTIDADGRSLDHVAPKYPLHLDTATIRHELLRAGTSPAAQGSGNAYALWFLQRVREDGGCDVPLGGRLWMDALLEVNAPFYGEVVTLYEPLACYRMHDSNWSGHHTLSPARFIRMVESFDAKLTYMRDRCQVWGIDFDSGAARDRSLWAFEYRLAAAKLASDEDHWTERPGDILWPAIRSCAASPFAFRHRIFRGAWIAAVSLLPLPLAARLIEARFVVAQRPLWLERLFRLRRGAGAVIQPGRARDRRFAASGTALAEKST